MLFHIFNHFKPNSTSTLIIKIICIINLYLVWKKKNILLKKEPTNGCHLMEVWFMKNFLLFHV